MDYEDPDDDVDDAALDAILVAADRELLGHVRTAVGLKQFEVVENAGASDEDVCLGLKLTYRLTAALDLALDLALAIPMGGGYASLRDVARSLSLHIALARDFEPDRARTAELAFAVDVIPTTDDLGAAQMAGRSRHLDFARIIVHLAIRGLARALSAGATEPSEALDIACTLAHVLDEAHSLELVQALARRLGGITMIDVSGADLSKMPLKACSVPAGTVWSEKTKWPAHLYAEIRGLSREIHPGSWRILR